MTTCLTIAADDLVYRAALAHPKSTPAFKPRVLQRLAAVFRQQAEDLNRNWAELSEREHTWWVNWANDDLPRSTGAEAANGVLFVGFTIVNMLFHRDDALEMLTAARILRKTVIDLRSREVWAAALADSDFVLMSEKGFNDFADGRTTVVALKDL